MSTLRRPQPFRNQLIEMVADSINRSEDGKGGWGVIRTPAKGKGTHVSTSGKAAQIDMLALAADAMQSEESLPATASEVVGVAEQQETMSSDSTGGHVDCSLQVEMVGTARGRTVEIDDLKGDGEKPDEGRGEAEEDDELEEEAGPPTVLSTVLKAVRDESASVKLAALQILVKSGARDYREAHL